MAARVPARPLRTSTPLRHGGGDDDDRVNRATVSFVVVDREGVSHNISGKEGDNLLYLAHRLQHDNPAIAIEGACEASLACSTCHVILSSAAYDALDEPSEVEDDMLDMAPCLTATSRLGCQVVLSKDLEGMTVTLPKFTRNFYVDGHVPEPH